MFIGLFIVESSVFLFQSFVVLPVFSIRFRTYTLTLKHIWSYHVGKLFTFPDNIYADIEDFIQSIPIAGSILF